MHAGRQQLHQILGNFSFFLICYFFACYWILPAAISSSCLPVFYSKEQDQHASQNTINTALTWPSVPPIPAECAVILTGRFALESRSLALKSTHSVHQAHVASSSTLSCAYHAMAHTAPFSSCWQTSPAPRSPLLVIAQFPPSTHGRTGQHWGPLKLGPWLALPLSGLWWYFAAFLATAFALAVVSAFLHLSPPVGSSCCQVFRSLIIMWLYNRLKLVFCSYTQRLDG